jgi:hypothetical protein
VIEEDQAREAREAFHEARELRHLPDVEEVRIERAEDEVERSVADDLISDRKIGAPRVANVRWLH